MQPGDKFGQLTAVRLIRTVKYGKHYKRTWLFKCDCGAEIERGAENVQTSFKQGNTPCCRKCHSKKLHPPSTDPYRIDLTGKKLGKLTALEPIGQSNWRRYSIWRFQCECGAIIERTASSVLGTLRRGYSPNCGKSSCNNFPKLAPGEAVKKQVIRAYRRAAYTRGFVFELPDELITRLMASNCFYCGAEPLTVAWRKDANGVYLRNGIDRVDSTKGYTPDNVVPCCKHCNRAKTDLSYDKFINWVKRVYLHLFGEPNNVLER